MLKRHLILIGIGISLILLVIASWQYPGGSQIDPSSVGYDLFNNYLCNFFSPIAVNGAPNPSMPWAIAAVLFLCTSLAIFFYRFAKRIPNRGATTIIRYGGVGAMFCSVFIVTPFHDMMINISGTVTMAVLFYITVSVFKSKLFWFKLFSVLLLVVAYATNYVYYSQNYLEWLPIMQKVLLLLTIIWILSLEYYARSEDFHTDTIIE